MKTLSATKWKLIDVSEYGLVFSNRVHSDEYLVVRTVRYLLETTDGTVPLILNCEEAKVNVWSKIWSSEDIRSYSSIYQHLSQAIGEKLNLVSRVS